MTISKNNKILAALACTMIAFGDTGIQNTTIGNWIENTAMGAQTQHDKQADSLLVAQTLVNQLTGNINSVVAKGVDTKQSALNTAFQLLLEEFKAKSQSSVNNNIIFNSLLSGLPNITTDAQIKAMISSGLLRGNKTDVDNLVSGKKYSASTLTYINNASTLQNFDVLSNSELNDATFSQLADIGKGDLPTINGIISQASAATSGFSSFGGIGDFGGILSNDSSVDRISTVNQSITTGTPDAIWEESYLRVLKSIIQYGDLAQHGSSIKLTAIANLLAQATGTKATPIQQVQTIIAGLQAESNGVRMYSNQEILNTLSGTDIGTTDIADFILKNTSLLDGLDISVRLGFEKSRDLSKSVSDQVKDMLNTLSRFISPENRYDINYVVKEILSAYSTTPSAETIVAIINNMKGNKNFFKNISEIPSTDGIFAAFSKNALRNENISNAAANAILIQKALLANGVSASALLGYAIDKTQDTSTQIANILTLLSDVISTENRYDIDYIVKQILSLYPASSSKDIMQAIFTNMQNNQFFFQNPSDQTGNLTLIAQAFQKNGLDLQTTFNFLTEIFPAPDSTYQYNASTIPNGAFQALSILHGAYTNQDIINWINYWGNSMNPGSLGSFFPTDTYNTLSSIAASPNGITFYINQQTINGYGSAPIGGVTYDGTTFAYTYTIGFTYN